jgi:hypothetical protein
VLGYRSQSWWLGPDSGGHRDGDPLASEVGFWAPQEDGTVEVMLAHPFGISEIYVGRLTGTRIELTENVVIRTSHARPVERSTRLYGIVQNEQGIPDLAYAMDMETATQPLQPHLSARLLFVTGPDA